MFKKSNAGDQLLIAVKLNKIPDISRLVALGVNVDSRIDKSGKTALHYAAFKGQLSAVKALIQAGADLDIADENGATALHRAVIDGHADIVKTLLKAGASVDKTDESGNTAVHESSWNGYSKCVELLVAAKCNVNIHNQTGYTSLHLAAQNGHCKTIQVLLNAGSNPLAKNSYGDTPLHIAVRYGHVKACEVLFETRINISEQNNDGSTALHIAASMGHEKLVGMLLRAGCLIGVRNNVGDTARDLAIQDGFKRIAQLLTPIRGSSIKRSKKEKKEERRPRSVDVSHLYSEITGSTETTLGTQLWIPRPADPENSVSQKSWSKRDFSKNFLSRGPKEDREGRKAAKPKQLIIKYEEMCSIEREYSRALKKRHEKSRRASSKKSNSRSSLKSQEDKICSEPGLHVSQEKFSRAESGKQNGAQSRDDLEVDVGPKKSKKDKGFFRLFRSSSDPDIHSSSKKSSLFGKKHKEKSPPSREVLGNGLSLIREVEEIKEKGEIEETKERKGKEKNERKDRDKVDKVTGTKSDKKSKTGKKVDNEDAEKQDRKEKKAKEKKHHSQRDEKDNSLSDCSICEMERKQKGKTHSKELKHKEQRSKTDKKNHKDLQTTAGATAASATKAESKDKDQIQHSKREKTKDEREHRKRKHHRDKEKEKEKDRTEKDKKLNKTTEKHVKIKEVESAPGPSNPAACSTCQSSLSRLEAWQERCTSEIDSARRKLEHRLQRLEKRLEEQLSDESQLKEKELREKEYERVVGRVSDECREVSKSVKQSNVDVRGEIRKLIRDGLGRLELKLSQVAAGYNMGCMDTEDRCNPQLGRNCAVERRVHRTRSRSSPHLGRTPCEDCVDMSGPNRKMSPLPDSSTVGKLSSSNSQIRVSQSDALDTLAEARPNDEGATSDETYAAAQVRYQRQVQEVDKWWRERAEEEQRVLYARICELEQMLTVSRSGGGCFV